MNVTALLRKAITQRKRVRMEYTPVTEGHLAGVRTIEPHALGKTRKGHAVVRAFVNRGVEGAQKEWRMFRVSQIENPELLPQTFTVKNDFNPKDKHMRPRPLVAQKAATRRSARLAGPRRSARLAALAATAS